MIPNLASLSGVHPVQYLTNRGVGTISLPYTIAISNTNYLNVQSAWNWQFQSISNGTATGQVYQVGRPQNSS